MAKNVGAMLVVAIATPGFAQSAPEIRLTERLDKDFRKAMQDQKPPVDDVFRPIEAFGNAETPRRNLTSETLPNGDIVLRRRDAATPSALRDQGAPAMPRKGGATGN